MSAGGHNSLTAATAAFRELIVEIVLLWMIVPAVIVALLAKNRGRSLHWTWWPVFLGWIGAIIAIIALVSKERIESAPEPISTAPLPPQPRRRQPDLRRLPRKLPAGGRVEVVGESRRQPVLWGIVGNRKPVDDRRQRIEAFLIPERDNPYDAWAVGVFINGEQVGYLPKEISRDWQPSLGEGGACHGWIVGGFETDDGELASLGVLLDLQESP